MKGDDPIYLIVVGGDGTLNEVLNGITDFDRVRLGVIRQVQEMILAET